MKKLDRKNYTQFVVRPVYCKSCDNTTAHSVFFVKMSVDQRHVLYFTYCNDCLNHAYQMQKDYYEQVLDIEFTEEDLKFDTVIEEATPADWKHLWMGDYYEHVEWDRIKQRK